MTERKPVRIAFGSWIDRQIDTLAASVTQEIICKLSCTYQRGLELPMLLSMALGDALECVLKGDLA